MKNEYTKQEYDRQKRMLKNIYDAPQFAPQFYWNAKYKTEEMKDKVPYIGIQDLLDYKYVMCAMPKEEVEMILFEFGRREVVKEYDSLDELVEDGWRLC